MLIDIISSDNIQSYNTWLAHKLGLHTSIYLSVLIELNSKAIKNNELKEDKFHSFNIDRDYITSKTTFSLDEQHKLDDILCNMCILKLSTDKTYGCLNFEVLTGLSLTENQDILNSFERVKKNASKEPKSTYILRSVKSKINPKYPYQIQQGLKDWLEALVDKFGFINSATLDSAQKLLDPIIYSDLKKAEEVIKICTINGYREMEWGINKYNSLQKLSVNNSVNTNVSMNSDKSINLSDDFF